MRIGLLSGTFDPVHDGHIQLAREALLQLELDEVWFMVDPNPPGKVEVTPLIKRQEMVERAVENLPRLVANREPIQRELKSHTVLAALELMDHYPDTEFALIMGSDIFERVPSWDDIEHLNDRVTFGVATRRGQKPADNGLNWRPIVMRPVEVSSSQVRRDPELKGIAQGVREYVLAEGLYGTR